MAAPEAGEVDAFDIDNEPSIAKKYGNDKVLEISRIFYKKVHADKEEWFRSIFTSSLEDAARDQGEFFVQRFGGPPLYSNRKGHPMLRGRHHKFKVTTKAADRWFMYMQQTITEMDFEEQDKKRILAFMKHVAYFLRNTADE
mmetsp:Transcript_10205/g.11291  ORF Transcript_10205/g.11291 Transcript_10205/m.11291 type:complete len:142 (-) Transcript_10205:104-529(-)